MEIDKIRGITLYDDAIGLMKWEEKPLRLEKPKPFDYIDFKLI